MNSLIVVLVLCCSVVVDRSNGQITGDCVIPDVDLGAPVHLFPAIDDVASGVVATFLNTENIEGLTVDGSGATYLTAEYDPDTKTLSFLLLPAFANFEDDIPITANPRFDLDIQVNMRCKTDLQKMAFTQPVMDTNNHDPAFTEAEFTYNLPMPFPALELTLLIPISATDKDYSQTSLVFSIDTPGLEADLSIEYGTVTDNMLKTHSAILRANKYLHLTDTISFEIGVSDGVNNGKATVHIVVDSGTSMISSPEFSQTDYSAKYVQNAGADSLEVTDMIQVNADDPAAVIVTSSDSATFAVTNNAGTITIELLADLPDATLQNDIFYKLTLTASVPGATQDATTILLIELPKQEECIAPTIAFAKPSFKALYVIGDTGVHSLLLAEPLVVDTADTAAITITLDNAVNFDATNTDGNINIILKADLDETTLTMETYYILTVTASPVDAPTVAASTILVIELPKNEECSATTTTAPTDPPTTECPTITPPTTDAPCTCPTDTTVTTTDCPTETTTVYITTECPTAPPTTECPTETTTVYITTECPTDPLTTECPTETTTVYITTECPTEPQTTDCPTEPTTTDCPQECPSTTTEIIVTTECPSVTPGPGEDGNVFFGYGIYPFHIPASFTGIVGKIEAAVTETEDVRYSIFGSAPPEVELNADTAEISVISEMMTDMYEFTIQAEGLTTGDKATTKIWIYVEGLLNCQDGAEFAYSLLVKDIEEETVNTNIFVVNDNQITEMPTISATPAVAAAWFSWNGNSLETVEIDREHEAIVETSQITLELMIQDPAVPAYIDILNPRVWIDIGSNNIPNNGKLLTIVLNVLDDNDNAPKFPSAKLTVGYPEPNLAADIMPQYITKVLATDLDKDSVISYSTDSENFVVNSETGTVYPKRNSIGADEEDQTLTVIADDGLNAKATMEITVKLLNIDHVAMIVASDKIVEDLDTVIKQLNTGNSMFQLHLISGAVIDDQSVGRTLKSQLLRASEDSTALKLVVYGLDPDNDLVTASDIETFVNNMGDYSAQTWESTTCKIYGAPGSNEDSNTPLIAVSVALGVLIVVVLVVGAFFYYYKIKMGKKNYKAMMDDDNSSSGGFEKNPKVKASITRSSSDMLSQRRPTGPGFVHSDFQLDDEIGKENNVLASDPPSKPRESVNLYVKNPNATTSLYNNNYSLHTNQQSPETEGRKSVTFDDKIQKIDIDVDDQENDGVRL